MFVIPGHPTAYGLIFFVCISCISLLLHNLATSLMEKVREDDAKDNLTKHTDLMLHDLAHSIAFRRQGGPLTKIWRWLASNFQALLEFIRNIKVIIFLSQKVSVLALQPVNDELWQHVRDRGHDGHYALMNWIRAPSGQS